MATVEQTNEVMQNINLVLTAARIETGKKVSLVITPAMGTVEHISVQLIVMEEEDDAFDGTAVRVYDRGIYPSLQNSDMHDLLCDLSRAAVAEARVEAGMLADDYDTHDYDLSVAGLDYFF